MSADVGEGTAGEQAFRHAMRDVCTRRNLRTVFQPVVSICTGDVVGFEALSRGPSDHPLEPAEELLEAAARAGMSRELNATLAWLARVRARQRIADDGTLLFINLDADCFHAGTSSIFDWDGDPFWPLDRTVIELTERRPVADVSQLVELREYARDRGARFALDDAGAGYAGLCVLEALRPDFIKVDAELSRDCDSNTTKQAIISSLVYIADHTGAEVIVEGIETMEELRTMRSLGVDLVQGFLLGSPEELPANLTGVRWMRRDRRAVAQSPREVAAIA
jgi:EAL domain-containing protein (putative c-di-GMP-specific phosphodiesterase class I)